MEKIKLHSVDQYNQLYGIETLHPLITIIDLTEAQRGVNNIEMDYGLYALFLKEGVNCAIKYGRRAYDYQEGTVVCFAPGQVVEVSTPIDEFRPKVYGILFHPDLIRRTPLADTINRYGYFSYSSLEALHLSERERQLFLECLKKIKDELERPIDKHSRLIIVTNIELLLNYCLRFYDRQFTTREDANKDILLKFELLISEYWQTSVAQQKGLPSVKYFADKFCLSPNYFGDLIKKETGKSAQEFIHLQVIERAKNFIAHKELSISEIAYELGFQYPQHFSRFFKLRVGVSPNEYRKHI
ncbi:MAG: helix-turn-helix domain-containing protein [Marinifilaceae bacterium]